MENDAPDESSLETRLNSRQAVIDFLVERRRREFPHVTDVSDQMGYGRKGSVYQGILAIERGQFPSEPGISMERFDAYLAAIGCDVSEITAIKGAITAHEGVSDAPVRPRASRGVAMWEYSDQAQPPVHFDDLHGRPGGWIVQRGREGGGLLFGDETYDAMRSGFAATGRNEMSVDEVVAYVRTLSGLYDGLRGQGDLIVASVRNEQGVTQDGVCYNHSIPDIARLIADGSFGGMSFDLAVSLHLPGYSSWTRSLERVEDPDHVPELGTVHNESLDRTVETARARLFLLREKGYVAAEMATGVLDRAIREYQETVEKVRDIVIEAGRYLVSHPDEFAQAGT